MKGFLKRDLYLMLPNLRVYGFFLLLIVCVSLFVEVHTGDFFWFYLTIFSAASILGLFSYDEANHWQAYAAAAPDGRRQQVNGRYAAAFLVGGAQMVLMSFFLLFSRAGNISEAFLCSGLFFLYADIALPVSYRFGNNSRVVMIVLVAAIAGLVGAGSAVLGIVSGAGGGIPFGLEYVLPAVGLAAFPLSRHISVGILERKAL